MGKPVKITMLTDSRDSVKGFEKAGKAAEQASGRMDSVAESSDRVASKGAQAAGALSGLGGLVGGTFGTAMATAGVATQALADSGDLLNVITESAIVRKIKDTAVTIAQTTATIAKSAADKAATAAQWALNAAMSANPVALLVIALIALVAAIVIAYKKSDKFREIVDKTFSAIRNVVVGAVSAVVGFVKSHWPLLLAILTGPIGLAVLLISKKWDSIIATVKALPGRIVKGLGNLKNLLLNAGKDLIGGLLDGIESMIGKVKSKLKGLTKLIPKLKGPPETDKRLLYSNGQLIINGLVRGMESRYPNVKRSLSGLSSFIATFGVTDPTLVQNPLGFAGTARGGAHQELATVRLHLTAQQVSQLQRGRDIRADLDAWDGLGGRKTT